MTLNIHWQLDVTDEPDRGEPSRRRPTAARDVRPAGLDRYDHYARIAQGASQTGFDGLFLPHREEGDDSRIVAAALARAAPRLTLIPEFPASTGSAVYAAKQAVSFQRAAHGRLGWAIAADLPAPRRAAGADPVSDDDLGPRTAEFLAVARGVHGQQPYSHAGRFFEVQDGGFAPPLSRVAFPTVFLGGIGEEALRLSAGHADVHLFPAAPPEDLRRAIEALGAFAKRAGRDVAYGLIQPVLARANDADVLEQDAGTIAGGYDRVADLLAERVSLGLSHLVLAARPSFEEVYRVGQFVLPRLRARLAPARVAA